MSEIHRLTADDWALWRTVRLRALAESPQVFGATLADWSGDGDVEERWRQRLEDVPANFIVFVDGAPVGQVSGAPTSDGKRVELISMWVAPEGRGLGLGDDLITAVVEWAGEQRTADVALWVKVDNDYAIALYQRHGFVWSDTPITDGEIEMVRPSV